MIKTKCAKGGGGGRLQPTKINSTSFVPLQIPLTESAPIEAFRQKMTLAPQAITISLPPSTWLNSLDLAFCSTTLTHDVCFAKSSLLTN
jgi:hypothetical protein